MTNIADWYYQSGNEPVGPLDFSDLTDLIIKRQLGRTSMVWKSGMDDWLPVESIDALAAFLPKYDTKLSMSSTEAFSAPPAESPAPQSLSVQEMLQHAHGVQPGKDSRSFVSSEPEMPQNAVAGFYHSRSFAAKWAIWFTIITAIGALLTSFIDRNTLPQNITAHPSAIWWIMFSGLNGIATIGYSLHCQFKNGPLWGFACFIPGVALVYVIKFWHDCWRSIAIYWFFCLNCAAGMIAMAPKEFMAIFSQI
ncbi:MULTISPECIES: DUF4339 domain-containing protein [unclassified Lentimonas]|uniref:DUF4339 domain-containing protein n=1 Tax=unclassified Lentimonas TaxID=2630993 RepID=UPI00132A4EDF|nr:MULTISPECIES: DUF4339 domain-containing protein [unclassified Lentimonas]CAA6678042.1 Unannotated [Lentimonas sp. CC4]CAA6687016.1 Unannotated [Lentimonas sp. CC6]CAA6696740.1 Unannotated [Lentimonas sp. CC10]CAA6697319.1 Unannotated [Lentimonas sp. CC19]CAA7072261.1 Unannotated [Lentimonas sp. CC11]